MNIRKYLVTLAATTALLGLSACGTIAERLPTAAAPSAPAPTPPALDEPPPLPLPETDNYYTPAERAYLATLADEGIALGPDAQAIEIGHKVCDVLDSGGSLMQVTNVIVSTGRFDHYDAGYIVGAATGSFCPAHLGEVSG